MAARILFFAYGCVAYLLFVATFLYAIAFIGGFGVPVILDGSLKMPFFTALLIDAGLLAVFAVQHSVMARPWFKQWWTQIVPWSIDAPALRAAVWALFAIGWLTVLVMTFYIDHFDLFGLRQVWLHLRGRQYARVQFATPVPYRVVRHPLYLGFVIAFWAAPTMSVTRFVFAAATTAYIVIAIQFEERDLAHEHGPSYDEYRRRTPMLIPGMKRAPASAAASPSTSR